MRSFALLIVLMAAFYVLLFEMPARKRNGNKASRDKENKPALVENEFENSFFEKGLPQDYVPQDLNRYGSVNKLIDDLDYRRMRMNHQMDAEMEEFKKTHDKNGKDREAYQALLKKHQDAKVEFKQKYAEQIKEYRKMKIEAYETNDKGLR